MWVSSTSFLAIAFAVQDVAGHVIARSATTSASSSTATPVKNTGKRGLAYNNPAYTTPFSLSGQNSQVSWAYNWNYEEANPSSLNSAIEYIPLLYNNNKDLLAVWPTAAQKAIDNGATALMSYNEPDFSYSGDGSNYMDIDTAVATWLKYMEPFAGKATLVAPAVTNVGSPAGLTWLQNFLDACTNCTIDAINIHWYSNKWAGATYLESHVNATRVVANGRPIWISEFGLDYSDGSYSDDDLHAFLKTAMAWLDDQDDIHRYAYFMATTGMLMNSAGTGLSDTGVLYNNYTVSSSTTSSSIAATSTAVSASSTLTSAITTSTTFAVSVSTSKSSSSSPSSLSVSTSSTKSASTSSTSSSKAVSSSTTSTSSSKATTSSSTSASSAAKTTTPSTTTTSSSKTTTSTSAAATATPSITILSAYFSTTNVTTSARAALLVNGNLVINTSTLSSLTSGTDPWWGVTKTLSILYTIGTQTRVAVLVEQSGTYTITPTSSSLKSFETIVPSFSVQSGSPVAVVAAVWGKTSVATQSLWDRLNYQATASWGFQLSTDLFGVDGFWGVQKSAVVWYRQGGVLKALVGKEGEWVKF